MTKITGFEVTKSEYRGIRNAYSEINCNFLLEAEPVVNLNGSEYSDIPIAELSSSILQIYIDNELIYINSNLGLVTIENKGLKSCVRHINDKEPVGWIRRCIFACLKQVIENGCIILPLNHYKDDEQYVTKKQEQEQEQEQGRRQRGRTNKTGMIAAPITISSERYICGIILKETPIQDINGKITNEMRLNITDACLLKEINQLCFPGSEPVSSDTTPESTTLAGYSAKLIISYLSHKYKDQNNPKIEQANNDNNKNQNENYTQNTKMRNNKQLYESIMKDVAKVVKMRLNETLADEIRKSKPTLDDKTKNRFSEVIKEIYEYEPDDDAFGVLFDENEHEIRLNNMVKKNEKGTFYYIKCNIKYEKIIVRWLRSEGFEVKPLKDSNYKVFLK